MAVKPLRKNPPARATIDGDIKSKRKKPDMRRRHYRDRMRAKVLWELAQIAMEADRLLQDEQSSSGHQNGFMGWLMQAAQDDRTAKAQALRSRIQAVMPDVQRAYEAVRRYPTKTLAEIRKTYPLTPLAGNPLQKN